MLDNDTLLKQAKRDFEASENHEGQRKWRAEEAPEDFDFVAGGAGEDSGQWSEDDAKTLEEQERPAITFNKIEPMIEGVTGTEVNNREQIMFRPRENSDKQIINALQEIAAYSLDNDVEEEDTDAFRNALICGMGPTAQTMSYDDELDGRFQSVAIDPLEFRWDPNSRRPCLADSRWRGYVRRVSRDEFEQMFPGQQGYDHVFNHKLDDSLRRGGSPENAAVTDSDYDPALATGGRIEDEIDPDMDVLVFEYQYFAREAVFRIDDGQGDLVEMSSGDFTAFREAAEAQGLNFVPADTPPEEPGQRYIKQNKRVFYRAWFSGGELLDHVPNNYPEGFSLNCITGRRHHRKGTWYGMVRAMKDPQRLTNKVLSQMVHHYNVNPKGGLIGERGTFQNPEEVENTLARPSFYLEAESGAVSGGQFHFVQPGQHPSSLDRLIQLAENAPPSITGVSLEFMAVANRDQPIGLEQVRRMATMTIMAPMFSSYRKYRKQVGRVLSYFIIRYYPERLLRRVLSPPLREQAPRLKDMSIRAYDVVVDEAPLTPSMRHTVFTLMQQMSQFMPPQVTMMMLPAFLRYSPLPQQMVDETLQSLEAAQKPSPEEQMLQRLEVALKEAEVNETTADAVLKQAKAAHESEKAGLERASVWGQNMARIMDAISKMDENDVRGQEAVTREMEAAGRMAAPQQQGNGGGNG